MPANKMLRALDVFESPSASVTNYSLQIIRHLFQIGAVSISLLIYFSRTVSRTVLETRSGLQTASVQIRR